MTIEWQGNFLVVKNDNGADSFRGSKMQTYFNVITGDTIVLWKEGEDKDYMYRYSELSGTFFSSFDELVLGLSEGLQSVPSTSSTTPSTSVETLPLRTHTIPIQKASISLAEAAGIYHFLGEATGVLPAWPIGTSGLSGRAVAKSETGFLNIPTTSNRLILKENNLINGVAGVNMLLVDVLFVNNGIVVTTTTAQTLNTVPLPARDKNRTINGADCLWGVLVTSPTTNAGVITTITGSYTDQDGNTGNTATIPSFPATATRGTFVPFLLSGADTGARSFQSITLGTTLAAGSISLVCMKIVDTVQTVAANISPYSPAKDVVLYGDEAITIMLMPIAASAYTIAPSSVTINEYPPLA